MRIFGSVFFFVILVSSCKTHKASVFDTPKNDTIQFTYLYSEALKNKMLGQNQKAYNQFVQCLTMNPASSASAYQLALLALEKSDFEIARQYADLCLKIKPDNEWFILLRASVAKEMNEKRIYQDLYKRLAELFPSNMDYAYEFAVIQYQNKNYNEALLILESLQEEVGLNENISFLKNSINLALERFDAIQLELLNLKKAFPDSVKYSDMLAEFYLNFNQPNKALRMYKQVLEIDSANVNAIVGISWIYGKIGRYTLGYPFLIKSLKYKNINFNRKLRISKSYLAANENRLDEDSIVNIYEILVKDHGLTSDFLSKYIAYLYRRKELSRAEKYALLAIEKFPDNYVSWDYYFNILLLQNRPEALNKYAKKGLEYFPNHAMVYFYCGYSYFLLKDYDDAVNYLEMGLDYVIDNKDVEKQFFLTLAESYHSISKHKQSDKYFEKYLAIDSTNAYLLNNYAYYLVQRNIEHKKALQLSRKSIELEPFNSSFLDTYSWILFTMNLYDKALNYIQRAYKYGGNKNPVILEHYGDILFKMGNISDAKARWNDAYKLTNSSIILEKINKINKINNN